MLGTREFYMLLGLIFILGLYYISSLNKYREKKLKLDRYKINMELEYNNEFSSILDTIISDTFNEYSVLNLAYNKDYINDEKEKQIISDVSSLVADRISNITMEKLSLYYNPSVIPDVISKKIYLTVMVYVLEHNKSQ